MKCGKENDEGNCINYRCTHNFMRSEVFSIRAGNALDGGSADEGCKSNKSSSELEDHVCQVIDQTVEDSKSEETQLAFLSFYTS